MANVDPEQRGCELTVTDRLYTLKDIRNAYMRAVVAAFTKAAMLTYTQECARECCAKHVAKVGDRIVREMDRLTRWPARQEAA